MQALWLAMCLGIGQSSQTTPAPLGTVIRDFTLRDHRGAERHLSDWREQKLVAIVFLGVDCPLARLYAGRLNELQAEFAPRGVAIVGINSNQHDSLSDLRRYVQQQQVKFPLLKDSNNAVADLFGATRTPEVFLLDQERKVRYRGRIDDQHSVGIQRAKPERRDLALAMEELLAGKPVRVAETTPSGCYIDRLERQDSHGPVTYHREIAPLLQKHCQVCHRPNQVAPFPLTTFEETIGWAETIEEVVRQRRMPPWGANPAHGHFANDTRLSDQERHLFKEWVTAGCPRGRPEEEPPPPHFPEGWSIPGPDRVLTMPQPFTVPAEGILDYQFIEVDPGFIEDTWIRAAEVRPGNRSVVHHCTIYLKPPGSTALRTQGALGNYCLLAWAPGTLPMNLPEGMAKLVPAGWKLVFVVHYVATGSVQTDQTSVGLVLAERSKVRREVATFLLEDLDLRLAPHQANVRVEKAWVAPADVLLLSLFPHMHYRGRSFRYEAHYPDGRSEILLDVPRYDFNWQSSYVLAEPKRLPRGTRLVASALYDNSRANRANPDPTVEVRIGPQSTDEMFNAYFDWALADQDLTQPLSLGEFAQRFARKLTQPVVLGTFLLAGGVIIYGRRLRRQTRGNLPTASG